MRTNTKYPPKAGIYKITCNVNGKLYIGKAVNLQKRLNVHKNCKTSTREKFHFHNAIIKYGWDSFTVEILEIFDNFDKLKDNDYLLEKESYYINLYESTNVNKGYNKCKFSKDTTGIPLSDEHKEKIRQSKLGKPISEYTKQRLIESHLGIPRSEETKEKIRQAHLGKPLSDEHRKRLSESHRGKKMSEENKKKLLEANIGRKLSEENKEKMRLGKERKRILRSLLSEST